MATCPNCNNEYNAELKSCPDCQSSGTSGSKKKTRRKSGSYYDYDSETLKFSFKTTIKLVVGIFLVIFIAGVIAGIMSDDEEQDSTQETTRIEIEKEIDFPPEPEVKIKPEELFDYNQLKPWDGQSIRNTSDEDQIRDLFMTIGSANLKEDINLFQTGYSSGFPDWNEKKLKTLAMWKKYDFITLGHYIAELDIKGDTAKAFLIWNITLKENGGTPQVMESTNEAILQKEAGGWKIIKLN